MKKGTISYIYHHKQFPVTILDILATIPTLFLFGFLLPKLIIGENGNYSISFFLIYCLLFSIAVVIVVFNLKSKRHFSTVVTGVSATENKSLIISNLQKTGAILQTCEQYDYIHYIKLKDRGDFWLYDDIIINVICCDGKILLNKRPSNLLFVWNKRSDVFDVLKKYLQRDCIV